MPRVHTALCLLQMVASVGAGAACNLRPPSPSALHASDRRFYLSQVTDLGSVLHMIGGTAAAFIIFFLPGLLLVNAAIVKLDSPPGFTMSGDLDAEAPLLVSYHFSSRSQVLGLLRLVLSAIAKLNAS